MTDLIRPGVLRDGAFSYEDRWKGQDVAKITHREVMSLHDAWANDASRWGENNLATVRSSIAYREARERWEREHGRVFVPKHRRVS